MKYFARFLLLFSCIAMGKPAAANLPQAYAHAVPVAEATPVAEVVEPVEWTFVMEEGCIRIDGTWYTLEQVGTEAIFEIDGRWYTLEGLINYARSAAHKLKVLRDQKDGLARHKAKLVDNLNGEIDEKERQLKELERKYRAANNKIDDLESQLRRLRHEKGGLEYDVSSLRRTVRDHGLLPQYDEFRARCAEEERKLAQKRKDQESYFARREHQVRQEEGRVAEERRVFERTKNGYVLGGIVLGAMLGAGGTVLAFLNNQPNHF